MPKIRIAALDLDGTLLSHENTITPRFFLTGFLACFFNATRKKLVTLDFCIFPEIR